MKYKIKWVIFRVGETHVLSFTLHFSYMCFLCYTGWQLCMYLYVHVPVCRCHGACMHVWRPEDSFGCWSFLSLLFAVVYPGRLVHKLLGILLSLFLLLPSEHWDYRPVLLWPAFVWTLGTQVQVLILTCSPSHLPSPLLYVLRTDLFHVFIFFFGRIEMILYYNY